MQSNVSRTHKGFTLIEVMVALVIFSIGMLGLAGLMTQSIAFNNSSNLRTQATFLAYDMLDRMRANSEAAIDDNAYDMTFAANPGAASCNGTGSNCDSAAIALADRYEWMQALQTLLPSADAEITQVPSGSTSIFVIEIRWTESKKAGDVTVGDESYLVIRSEL